AEGSASKHENAIIAESQSEDETKNSTNHTHRSVAVAALLVVAPDRRQVLSCMQHLNILIRACPSRTDRTWPAVTKPDGTRETIMKLTRAASYALHALVFMAGQKKNQPVPSHQVARARGIPERFLLKVLKPLVSARILHSVKGPNGGYRLARPASQVSLLELVEAV